MNQINSLNNSDINPVFHLCITIACFNNVLWGLYFILEHGSYLGLFLIFTGLFGGIWCINSYLLSPKEDSKK